MRLTCSLCKRVQPSCLCIRFDLCIPEGVIEFSKPPAKLVKLLSVELLNSALYFF